MMFKNATLLHRRCALYMFTYIQPFRRTIEEFPKVYSTHSLLDAFEGKSDMYNGITVETAKQNCELELIDEKLEESLRHWAKEGRRCIWFKVNIKDSQYVPRLAQKGFHFHHARDDYVMMFKWLPKDSKPNLPPSSYLNLGVGAMVFNNKGQMLAISEKNYDYPHYKLPGGYVNRGEEIIDAAIREVKEETGVDCSFESLVTFRHTHNMMFGNTDIYILLRMKALSHKIVMSDGELRDCKWMDVEEYTTHPHVHAFNRFIVKKALEYKQMNIKLNLEKKSVKWSKFVRDMNYLVVEKCK